MLLAVMARHSEVVMVSVYGIKQYVMDLMALLARQPQVMPFAYMALRSEVPQFLGTASCLNPGLLTAVIPDLLGRFRPTAPGLLVTSAKAPCNTQLLL